MWHSRLCYNTPGVALLSCMLSKAVQGPAAHRRHDTSAGHALRHAHILHAQANAEHLAAELPLEDQGRVLYPASAKAGSGLQVRYCSDN